MGFLDGIEPFVRSNVPLRDCTWLALGGPAEYFAEPTSQEELLTLVERCRDENLRVRMLGGGSNILVRDEGVPGVVIRLSAPCFGQVAVKSGMVTAGGGAKLGQVIATSVGAGLAGLEQLVGIPGTIGGALHGNAGSHGGDIGQWTRAATVLTRSGEIVQRPSDDMQFAYRQSSLDELVILSAEFQLEEANPEELTRRMQKLWIINKTSQPAAGQATGCIFKNPRGVIAASLIEQAGLKGTRVGQVAVCEQDANFLIAEAGATAADALRLIELIRTQVEERMGVELENQIEVW